MKKLRIRTEYLVLGAVIVVLALAIALRGTNRLRYKLPTVPAIKVEDISRITVKRASGDLELEKKDGTWRIVPEGYKADASQVSPLVAALAQLDLTTLVSEAASYGRYGLDETGRMTVTAYTAEKQVRVVEVGKEDEGSRTSFVMLPGNDKVYTARQNFRGLFDVEPDKLRDMTVLEVSKESIVAITARRGAETLELTRSTDSAANPPTETWKSAAGELWDPEAVDRFLGVVSRLKAQRYGQKADDLGAEQLSIFVKTSDGSGSTLAVHAKTGAQYGALSSQSDYPFYITEYQYTDMTTIFDGKKAAES